MKLNLKKIFLFLMMTVSVHNLSAGIVPENFRYAISDDDSCLSHCPVLPPDAPTAKIGGESICNFAKEMEEKNNARYLLLSTEFQADGETVRLGISADWWFNCYVNGELVFGTMERGNEGACGGKWHGREIQLKKGLNRIDIVVERGVGSCTVACRELKPDEKFEPAQKLVCEDFPVLRRESPVLYGPWQCPYEEGLLIRCVTSTETPLGIEFRTGDETECLVSKSGKYHAFVWNLPAGTRGSYRLFVPGDTPHYVSKTYSAVQPEANQPMRFFVMGDTQTSGMFRLFCMRSYFELAEAEGPVDFAAHIGDIDSITDNFHKRYAGAFVEPYLAITQDRVPLAVVHGNHEYYGNETQAWGTIFGDAEGNPFYWFRRGNCACIVLDFGDGRMENVNPDPQIEMMKKVVETEAWKNAKWRILFVHQAIPDGRAVKQILGEFKNFADVDFCFAGDDHRTMRSIPGKPFAMDLRRNSEVKCATAFPFPVVTMEGPLPGKLERNTVILAEAGTDEIQVRFFFPEGNEYKEAGGAK